MRRTNVVALALALSVIVCALVIPPSASAQQATASGIAGVVKDTSGAVLPGVTVEAASPALIERVRSVVSDSEGRFRAPVENRRQWPHMAPVAPICTYDCPITRWMHAGERSAFTDLERQPFCRIMDDSL